MKRHVKITLCLTLALALSLCALPALAQTFSCVCGGEGEEVSENVFLCPSCGGETVVDENGSFLVRFSGEDGSIEKERYYSAEGALYAEFIYGGLDPFAEKTDEAPARLIARETWYDEYGVNTMEYNEYGDLIRNVYTNAEGVVEFTEEIEYVYSKDGVMQEKKVFHDGKLVMETRMQGDAQEVLEYFSDGGYALRHYNEGGDLTMATEYDAQGQVVFETTYGYVYDGERLVSQNVCENGVLVSETVYGVTADGWAYVESSTEYHEDGSKTVFLYDDHSYLVRLTDYDAKGEVTYLQTIDCTYDDEGRILHETWYADGVLSGEMFYEIGEEGRSIIRREVWYLEDGGQSVVEYDDYGAPIQETQYDAEGKKVYESDEVSVG